MKVTKPLLLGLVISSLLYLVFSFGAWDLNPKNWNDLPRVFMAMLVAGAFAISFLIHNPSEF